MNLSGEQFNTLANGQPVYCQEQGIQVVVMRADVFERVKATIYDANDWGAEEMRASLARAAEGHGWNEPGMDQYDHYDEHRR